MEENSLSRFTERSARNEIEFQTKCEKYHVIINSFTQTLICNHFHYTQKKIIKFRIRQNTFETSLKAK